MKCKARVPFYNSDLGIIKRNQILDVPTEVFKALGDFLEEINDRPDTKQSAGKSQAKPKSRNKRVQ